jgi:hypothetical protein
MVFDHLIYLRDKEKLRPSTLNQAVVALRMFYCHDRTVDVLYCNSLGKDLSAQGMHTKTIGRSPYGYQQGKPWKSTMPAIHTIVGSRLSPGSHGNAIGVGLCEFITRWLSVYREQDLSALRACVYVKLNPTCCIIALEHSRDLGIESHSEVSWCWSCHKRYVPSNDPSSATRRTGRHVCNGDAPAGFAAAHG